MGSKWKLRATNHPNNRLRLGTLRLSFLNNFLFGGI